MARTQRWPVGLTSALAVLLVLSCAPAASGPAAAPAAGQGRGSAAGDLAASGGGRLAPELQTLIDAARQEGALNLVWSDGALGSSEDVSRLGRAFNAYYGLNLDVRFTPGPSIPEMAAKLA